MIPTCNMEDSREIVMFVSHCCAKFLSWGYSFSYLEQKFIHFLKFSAHSQVIESHFESPKFSQYSVNKSEHLDSCFWPRWNSRNRICLPIWNKQMTWKIYKTMIFKILGIRRWRTVILETRTNEARENNKLQFILTPHTKINSIVL